MFHVSGACAEPLKMLSSLLKTTSRPRPVEDASSLSRVKVLISNNIHGGQFDSNWLLNLRESFGKIERRKAI